MAEMFERHPFRRRDLLHGLGGLANRESCGGAELAGWPNRP
jgi:hypothetical protein